MIVSKIEDEGVRAGSIVVGARPASAVAPREQMLGRGRRRGPSRVSEANLDLLNAFVDGDAVPAEELNAHIRAAIKEIAAAREAAYWAAVEASRNEPTMEELRYWAKNVPF